MNNTTFRFWILVAIVAISGFSQGLLLPLIAVIFEQNGLSSSLNGIHATGLYIGVLLASPFMEKPLRSFGYKPIIIIGGLVVIVSLLLFPMWDSLIFWFLLRLFIGIGDHMLHFGTQTWITSFSPEHKRGRNISLYGLSFGIGFAFGPLMTPLVTYNPSLPFIITAILSLFAWATVFFLKNELPENLEQQASETGTLKRFIQTWKYAWVAFLPPFGYGFLEASLNGNFPVYALRSGIDVTSISILLPAFAIGSILFQLPLGILSDKYGRRTILMIALFTGFSSFTVASFLEHSIFAMFVCFFIAGMMVGSAFSLGISYMTDLVPKSLLPSGNILCGIFFSFGSISGPFLGGLYIQFFNDSSFFHVISFMLLILFILLASFREQEFVAIKH